MADDLYPTMVSERGRRFSREKLWKGQRPVDEATVEHHREIARSSPSDGERDRAREWLEDYERARRET